MPDGTPHQPTREELEQAEEYLRELNLPADDWLLRNPQQHFLISEVIGRLFGMDEDAVRGAASRGEIPGSVLPNQRTGWRLDRNGLVWYIAERRRAQEQRIGGQQAAG